MNLDRNFTIIIRNTVKKYFPEAKVFLFGSRAKGTNRQFSDVDIAVKNPIKLNSKNLALIRFELEESNLPYKVDLSDYEDLDKEILTDAIEI